VFRSGSISGEAGYTFDLRNEARQEEWRLQGGLESRERRSLIGEFSEYEETYRTWGFWIDL